MKLPIAVTTLLLLAFTLSPPAWAASRLTFDKPVFDFGQLTQGKKVEHAFFFRNTGTAPVTIQRIGSSCGCTAAAPSSRVINPGQKGEIRATFDSAGFNGPVNKELFVYTDDPAKPANTLVMKGVVVEELVVSPAGLNLGEVRPGVRAAGTLKIQNKGTSIIRIKEIRTAVPQVTAACDKKTLKPGETAAISVSLVPRGSGRFINGYLTIVTDGPDRPAKEVPFYSVVKQ